MLTAYAFGKVSSGTVLGPQLKYILETAFGRVRNKFQKSVCKFHILGAAIVV